MVLLIHGMSAGGWCWDEYKGFLEKRGYRCLAPNLRFHGEKDVDYEKLGKTSLLDYAADLEHLVKSLDEKPIIIGHSMGGLLAQILASRKLSRATVLLAPAPPYGIVVANPVLALGFLSILTTCRFWEKPVLQTFDEARYSMLNLLSPKKQELIYKRLTPESGRAVFEMGLWFLDKNKAAFVHEKKIESPLLVIGGRKDRAIPASVIKKIYRKYRNKDVEFRLYPDNAHWLVSEPGWQEIAEHIHRWLESKV